MHCESRLKEFTQLNGSCVQEVQISYKIAAMTTLNTGLVFFSCALET